MFDAVAPPARRWAQAIFTIGLIALFGPLIAHAVFGAPIIPAILVCIGLGALLWAWALHHRVRMALASAPERR